MFLMKFSIALSLCILHCFKAAYNWLAPGDSIETGQKAKLMSPIMHSSLPLHLLPTIPHFLGPSKNTPISAGSSYKRDYTTLYHQQKVKMFGPQRKPVQVSCSTRGSLHFSLGSLPQTFPSWGLVFTSFTPVSGSCIAQPFLLMFSWSLVSWLAQLLDLS